MLKKDGKPRKITWRSICPFCGHYVPKIKGVSMCVELDDIPDESYACDKKLAVGTIRISQSIVFYTYWVPEQVVDVYVGYLKERYGVVVESLKSFENIESIKPLDNVTGSENSLYKIPLDTGGAILVTSIEDYNDFVNDIAFKEAQKRLRDEGIEKIKKKRRISEPTFEEKLLLAYNRMFGAFDLNILKGNKCQVLNAYGRVLFEIKMDIDEYDKAIRSFVSLGNQQYEIATVKGIIKQCRNSKIFKRFPYGNIPSIIKIK